MVLTSYGSVSQDFKVMAQLTKLFKSIKAKEIEPHRVDCYPIGDLQQLAKDAIEEKFSDNSLVLPKNMEVFYPSQKYPAHRDSGGRSFFIPLESGVFTFDNIDYPIVPFVVYSFEDSEPHNTNFGAIMLK